jgi:hypothetical protein
MSTNRQPKGQSNGGEFAPDKNPESNVELGPSRPDHRIKWTDAEGHKYDEKIPDIWLAGQMGTMARSMDEALATWQSQSEMARKADAQKAAEKAAALPEPEFFAPWAITRQNVGEALLNAAALVKRHGDSPVGGLDLVHAGEIIGRAREIAEEDAGVGDLAEWLDEINTKVDYFGDMDEEKVSCKDWDAHAASIVNDLTEAASKLSVDSDSDRYAVSDDDPPYLLNP